MPLIDAAGRWRSIIAPEGLIMLAASLVLIGLTGGLSMFLVARHVARVGQGAPANSLVPATAVVPGKAPHGA